MAITSEAIRVLRQAEKSLRDLLAKAATEGDYEALMQIGEWARNIASLLSKTIAAPTSRIVEKPSRARLPKPHGEAVQQNDHTRAHTARHGVSKRVRYPQFVRDGENLVKIGWSKSEKAEYEHKAPKRVLLLVVSALAKTSSNAKRITMEKVLPLTDPVDGSDVPSYQAYLCLAWLRSLGLVVQHGRQGYSISKGRELESAVEEQWRQVAER